MVNAGYFNINKPNENINIEITKIYQKNLFSLAYRLQHGGGHKNQAIAKAIGTSNKKRLNVIDATCGFGTDSIVLAYFNCQVHAIEKHPKVSELLAERFNQAMHHKLLKYIIPNIKLFTGDCLKIIPKIINESKFIPDVIYLDPMFNQKTTAAPNKLIQILQYIIANYPIESKAIHKNNYLDDYLGDGNQCSSNLLTSILNLPNLPVKRIVVKRARLASYLENLTANFSIIGKSNRFDVYLT